jgi:MFS family permease
MSYGVFQEEYSTNFQLKGNSNLTGIVGTTLNGVLYMSLPLIQTLLATRLSQWRRTVAVVGLVMTSSSLVLSASSTEVWHLIVTQGILCGLGSALLYSPTMLFVDEWWLRRKSYAYGVSYSAKNIVGTVTPFIIPALLNRVGLQNTLRLWGGLTFVTGAITIPFMHARLQQSTTERTRRSRRTSWKFLTHPTFYIFHIANIVFSSGYGLPQTYLPSYAKQVLHLPSAESSLMLALFNLPGIISCVIFGMLGDGTSIFGFYSPTPFTVTFISAIGSALSVFLIWGLAPQYGVAGLAAFSAIYGFFAGAYSSTWGGALKEIEREAIAHNEVLDTGVVYGLFNGGRGLGFLFGGLAGVELLKGGAVQHTKHFGYGTEYGTVIVYTGISAVIGGWSVLWNLASSH